MVQKVIHGTSVPAKLWLNSVENSCMEQIVNLASLPFAFKHIAVMPDAHAGKGMPIGGVLATKGVVVPNAVGVDIGCGMCAIKTNLKAAKITRNQLVSICYQIKKSVPLGCENHSEPVDQSFLPDVDWEKLPYLKDKTVKILHEIGTLGGGNHFIELQRDTQTDDVWAMIHSGSRNTGLQVANHYGKMAQFWCEKWYANTFPELAFLPIETQMGHDYYAEMQACVKIAFANRSLIMTRVQEAILHVLPQTKFDKMINIAHNYAAWERHFGENVVVHRKGATSAKRGEIGIIPGSMGTKSYIVEGLGNPESFMSCSHGAGRVMSRTAAKKQLSLADECQKLDSQGIVHSMKTPLLDEAPGAYKDIAEVLAFESDLVRPIVELTPLAVVKGE